MEFLAYVTLKGKVCPALTPFRVTINTPHKIIGRQGQHFRNKMASCMSVFKDNNGKAVLYLISAIAQPFSEFDRTFPGFDETRIGFNRNWICGCLFNFKIINDKTGSNLFIQKLLLWLLGFCFPMQITLICVRQLTQTDTIVSLLPEIIE